MNSGVFNVEAFVGAVARAFYTDPFVVVLDALVHEKFIMEEELPARLKQTTKDISKITRQLEEEMLIKSENVKTDDGSLIKYLYIDYQTFYYVVLYRISRIQNTLQADEKIELHQTFFRCPSCAEVYTELQALRQIAGDKKFICTSCCPVEHFQHSDSEPYYRLETVDNRGKIDSVQLLRNRFEEQLKRSRFHEGIFDLLIQLRDIPLGDNLPSENLKRGLRSSVIHDEDVLANVQYNLNVSAGTSGSSRISKDAMLGAGANVGGQHTGLKLNIEIDTTGPDSVPPGDSVEDDEHPSKKTRFDGVLASSSQQIVDGGTSIEDGKAGETWKEASDDDDEDDTQWNDDDADDDHDHDVDDDDAGRVDI